MTLNFRTMEQRDALARRLSDLAVQMIRSCDQGNDRRIAVDEEMIGDLRAAAYIVGMTPILGNKDRPVTPNDMLIALEKMREEWTAPLRARSVALEDALRGLIGSIANADSCLEVLRSHEYAIAQRVLEKKQWEE